MKKMAYTMLVITGLLLNCGWVEGTDAYTAVGSGEYLAKGKVKRIYQVGVTDTEIKDIRFIVTTLGNVPILKLKNYKNALESAGDRVDHVHPLNFWKAIFTDKEMISAMHSIRRRTLVWKKFMTGMGKSLQEEKDHKNLRPEFVEEFCQKLGVPYNAVNIQLSNSNWKGFVRVLLEQVPREGESDRYNL